MSLSDESLEAGNGRRKTNSKAASQQTMERDLLMFETQQLKSWDSEGLCQTYRLPKLMEFDGLHLCHCVVAKDDIWKRVTRSLQQRLSSLGLAAHAKEQDGGKSF